MESGMADQCCRTGRHRDALIFVFPVFLLLVFLCVKVFWPTTYQILLKEDSVVEYVQVFSYLLTAAIAMLVSMQFKKNGKALLGVMYGMLSFLLVLVSLEEISWGQRILDIESPEYFERNNIQHEITVHNLKSVQHFLPTIYSLVGIYGAFAWIFLRRLAQVSGESVVGTLHYLVPAWHLSSYFFLCFIINTMLAYILPLDSAFGIGSVFNTGFLAWREQELAELFLSFGFLGFCMSQWSKVSTSPQVPRSPRMGALMA